MEWAVKGGSKPPSTKRSRLTPSEAVGTGHRAPARSSDNRPRPAPVRLRQPCSHGCKSDHTSLRNDVHHLRLNHQAIRCRFDCPGCGYALGADLHSSDQDHLKKCYNPDADKRSRKQVHLRFPREEFWETDNRRWEGSALYTGDTMYLDPYAFLEPLYRPVTRFSEWVLRMNLCALLYEQLLMLELYGGCTLNVDEIVVPHNVYRGLERLVGTTAFMQEGGVRDPPTRAPPGGIPASPDPMPVEDVMVTPERVRRIQQSAPQGNGEWPLAVLAQTMRRRGRGLRPMGYILTTADLPSPPEPAAQGESEEEEPEEPKRKPKKLVRISHQVISYRPAGYSDEGSQSPRSPSPFTRTIFRDDIPATVSRAPRDTSDGDNVSSGTEELSRALDRTRLRSSSLDESETESQSARRPVVHPEEALSGTAPGTQSCGVARPMGAEEMEVTNDGPGPEDRQVVYASDTDRSQTGSESAPAAPRSPLRLTVAPETYSGRYTRVAGEHLQHAVAALMHQLGRCESQDELQQQELDEQTRGLQVQLSEAMHERTAHQRLAEESRAERNEARQERDEARLARAELQGELMDTRRQLDAARRNHLDRAREIEEIARERDEGRQNEANLGEDVRLYRDQVYQQGVDLDGRLEQLEKERSQRRLMEAEILSLRTELSGLRNQPGPGRSLMFDPRLAAEAVLVVDMAEQAMVSRVAEAIRRTEAETEALAAGVTAEVYRRAATNAQCACALTAQATLQAAAVPGQRAALNQTVQVVLREIEDGGMADLAGHPYGVYKFDDQADRTKVDEAHQQGRRNLATYAILRDTSCRFARRVAGDVVACRCPGLTAAALAGAAGVTAVAVIPTGASEVMSPPALLGAAAPAMAFLGAGALATEVAACAEVSDMIGPVAGQFDEPAAAGPPALDPALPEAQPDATPQPESDAGIPEGEGEL